MSAARRRHGLDGPYVLWVGTIEPRKNLPALLDAFASLPERDARSGAGRPAGVEQDLDHRLRRLGDRVAGPSASCPPSELRALYAGASVFCFPSLQEGFGLPVLEAMAQGTPVVTSRGTATEEVVGDAGVLVEPRDVAAMAEALGGLLDDPVRRRRAGPAWCPSRRQRLLLGRSPPRGLEAVYEEAAA